MPTFSLRNWRWTHLLLASIAYWIVLVSATVVPAVMKARQFMTGPEGRGEISVSASASQIDASIAQAGTTTWSVSYDVLLIALALTIPPLLLWVLWVVQRPARRLDDVVAPLADVDELSRLRQPDVVSAPAPRPRETVRPDDRT